MFIIIIIIKLELLVEVRRARVNRGGFRLVIILVRLGATRKHGFTVQPTCLVLRVCAPSKYIR